MIDIRDYYLGMKILVTDVLDQPFSTFSRVKLQSNRNSCLRTKYVRYVSEKIFSLFIVRVFLYVR